MSIADKYRPHYKYEDYLAWEGRWELIEGMPYAMSPSPIGDHQDISFNLGILFKSALAENCNKCKVYLFLDWRVSEHTVVQPDLSIVCDKSRVKYIDSPPSITVEILSPSTASKDRHEKFELYEQEGVKYYLIIDPQFKKLEIYELVNEKYQLSKLPADQFVFSFEEECSFSLNFDEIWP